MYMYCIMCFVLYILYIYSASYSKYNILFYGLWSQQSVVGTMGHAQY